MLDPKDDCQEGDEKLDLQRADATSEVPSAVPLPMNAVWRTIRGYIWWSYERGSLHYDVMVTLILLFVVLSPSWINFNDKPVERNPHPTGVAVVPDAGGGLIYQIDASAVSGVDDAAIRDELRKIIEPISGAVAVTRFEAIRDRMGRTQSYKVWVQKE